MNWDLDPKEDGEGEELVMTTIQLEPLIGRHGRISGAGYFQTVLANFHLLGLLRTLKSVC